MRGLGKLDLYQWYMKTWVISVVNELSKQTGGIPNSSVRLGQRWKNFPACQQCWCKFFPSSGKMCAKTLLCFVTKVSYVSILRFLA
jgi:hypothetical protein